MRERKRLEDFNIKAGETIRLGDFAGCGAEDDL
jgi:hypothetical protein